MELWPQPRRHRSHNSVLPRPTESFAPAPASCATKEQRPEFKPWVERGNRGLSAVGTGNKMLVTLHKSRRYAIGGRRWTTELMRQTV